MVWFRSSAPDWPYYTQCSTIPQIPLAKGSERVSGWRREMAYDIRLVGRHPRMSSSHHLTILRTSSLTIRENPRKRLGVGQLQILSPVVDSLSNRVNGCCWAVCETAAKLTSCRAAISPLRLCRVWMRPDLTGMLVRLHVSKTFVSSRKSRCPPPATRRPP